MRFTVDKQAFHKAISVVENIISAREIRSVISNIHLEASDNKLILTTTDLEIGMKTRLDANVEQPGAITLPAKKLSQSVREFRGSKILFESDSEEKVNIQDPTGTSRARFTLMGAPADEYPGISALSEENYSTFPTAVFQQMVKLTGHSIAEEDARYVFNGLYIVNDGSIVSFVGTDGRRLSKIDRDITETLPFVEGVILPNKAVREVQKLFDGGETGQIAFDENDRRVHFRIGDVDLISKLIDGQFPDYHQVIPKKLTYHLTLDRSAFENSLRQVAVMAAEPSRQVRVTFSPGNLGIQASTPDIGEAQDSLNVDYSGEEMTIAFNSNYLLDVIKVIDAEEITLGFSSPSAPAVIMNPKDENFVSVIMPMKL